MDTAIISVIETVAIVAFSVSGAIFAIDGGMDLFGVVFLSLMTCFGGGIMRDIILGRTPLFFTSMWILVSLAFAFSLLTFIVAKLFGRSYVRYEGRVLTVINYVDALGIGAFSVSGVKMCIEAFPEHGAFLAIMMGVMTAVGGGIIRDICMRTVPFVLKKRIYALASLIGASLYYLLSVYLAKGVLGEVFACTIGILAVFIIRVLATVFKWNLPRVVNAEEKKKSPDTPENKDEILKV